MALAAGLHARGLVQGDKVAIMLPTGREFFAAFFGTLYAGCVPVPLYPPARPSQLEDHLAHRRHPAQRPGADTGHRRTRQAAGPSVAREAEDLKTVDTVADLSRAGAAWARPALPQPTSRSCNTPPAAPATPRAWC